MQKFAFIRILPYICTKIFTNNKKEQTLMKKIFTLIALAAMALGVNAETLIDFAQVQNKGIEVSGTTAISSVKIHNKDAIAGIKFANSYTSEEKLNDNYAKLTVEGGFKAGDVVTIAGAFNNSDNTKKAAVDLFTADGDTPTVLFTTQQFINGKDAEANPVEETFTLTADADVLYIGRNGNTATFVTTLKVVRGEESDITDPDPVLPPTEAKAWDFTTTTAESFGDGWSEDSSTAGRYVYGTEIAADNFVDLGTIGFSYGAGISVGRAGGNLAEKTIRVDTGKQIQLNASNGAFKITGLAKDDVVKIRYACPSEEERTFSITNGDKTSITAPADKSTVEESVTVAKNGDLTLIQSKAINVKAIAINSELPEVSTGIETVNANVENNGAIYNLAGQKVSESYKGVVIQNGVKMLRK